MSDIGGPHWLTPPSARRSHAFLRTRRLAATAFFVFAELWLFWVLGTGEITRINWPLRIVTLAVVVLGFLWACRTIQARRDRKIMTALRRQASLTGPEAETVLLEALTALHHPGNKLAVARPLITGYSHRGAWQQCGQVIERLPRPARLGLGAASSDKGNGLKPPVAVSIQSWRLWLMPVWPAQATRALLTLEAAQSLLHHRRRYGASAAVGRAIWRTQRAPSVAWNVACSAALGGDDNAAITWLERAVKHGADPAAIANDPDLISIANDPKVAAMLPPSQIDASASQGPVIGPYLDQR